MSFTEDFIFMSYLSTRMIEGEGCSKIKSWSLTAGKEMQGDQGLPKAEQHTAYRRPSLIQDIQTSRFHLKDKVSLRKTRDGAMKAKKN